MISETLIGHRGRIAEKSTGIEDDTLAFLRRFQEERFQNTIEQKEYTLPMDYIIDGYNLIFQCGLQKRSASDDMLRKARQRMIHEILAGVSKTVAKRITIVFDAAKPPLLAKGNSETIGGMKIFYADQYDDADSMIEHLIAKHSVPRKLTVVSSDHRLHRAALRRKAISIDSDLWFDQLEAFKLDGNPSQRERRGNQEQRGTTGHVSEASSSASKPSEELKSIDWQAEFATDDVDIAKIKAQLETEGAQISEPVEVDSRIERVEEGCEPEPETDVPFNPFPPGYGEDLLDD